MSFSVFTCGIHFANYLLAVTVTREARTKFNARPHVMWTRNRRIEWGSFPEMVALPACQDSLSCSSICIIKSSLVCFTSFVYIIPFGGDLWKGIHRTTGLVSLWMGLCGKLRAEFRKNCNAILWFSGDSSLQAIGSSAFSWCAAKIIKDLQEKYTEVW